ncbi:isopropylmalate isomerase small subunit [Novosphingobium sp. Rr 2-17]|uniref:3-isopropylmalate dehydratase small subunit n=1 Tax=Novosphingobium sp. Rr 2-17 TaxID=555793 RepID=UPI00026984C4|nr:3-isopropylmalate dehydratase small subunit [Novosphingobium sp. Rr 2-17]EIZ80507.1 isopropylmalate isomerase small subunit [Novosphingobium sp. Rr 2-17]
MPAQPFITVSGLAAAMREENIDTDIIFPARFLLITARAGLGRYAFHDRRFNAQGREVPGYVLNRPGYAAPPVIVAGANFGSGSSREQAVWALVGLGTRAVIASSFGEIFFSNCLRNGVVPIRLPEADVAVLMDAAEAGAAFTVDLEAQELRVEGQPIRKFVIAPERRLAMLNGWDETDQILNQYSDDIASFEQGQRAVQPWLYV